MSSVSRVRTDRTEFYQVRVYRASDYFAVIALWKTCFPNDPAWNDPAEIIRLKLTQQPELFFVCISGGQVVGSVLAGFDGFRGWINKLATRPDHQYKGVATLLLKAAEEALVELGCPKINLQVRAENAEVVSVYVGAGYAVEPLISMGKRVQVLEETESPT